VVDTLEQAFQAGEEFGYPFMLKNRKMAYDGKGNFVVKSEDALTEAFETLGGKDLYAEKWIPFVKELAVMVVRTKSNIIRYPVVETIQENNVCNIVIAPAQISLAATNSALSIALQAVESLSGIGIYGVELFLSSYDSILLNEIAPRFLPFIFFFYHEK
jgi:phosphoribosylaminoimidazole carboxylase